MLFFIVNNRYYALDSHPTEGLILRKAGDFRLSRNMKSFQLDALSHYKLRNAIEQGVNRAKILLLGTPLPQRTYRSNERRIRPDTEEFISAALDHRLRQSPQLTQSPLESFRASFQNAQTRTLDRPIPEVRTNVPRLTPPRASACS